MPRARDSERVEYDECEELLEAITSGSRGCSNTSGLILQLNAYLKKPQIEQDLRGILCAYLAKLQSTQGNGKDGVLSTNFAEAALLLQGSVQLYSKKVDLFWDFIMEYLKRNLSYEEKTEENQEDFTKLEERTEKYKRKRKVRQEEGEQEDTPSNNNTKTYEMDFGSFQKFMAIGNLPSERSKYGVNYNQNWEARCKAQPDVHLDNKIRCGTTLPTTDSLEERLLRNAGCRQLLDKMQPPVHDLYETSAQGAQELLGDYGSSSSFERINREFYSQYSQVCFHNIPPSQIQRRDVEDFVLQQQLTANNMRIEQVYRDLESLRDKCKSHENHTYKLKTKIADDKIICYLEKPQGGSPQDELVAVNSEVEQITLGTSAFSDIIEKRSDPTRKTVDSDLESGVFDTCSNTSPSILHNTSSLRSMSENSEGIEEGALTPKNCRSRSVTPTSAAALASCQKESSTVETIIEEVIEKLTKRLVRKKLFADDDDEQNDDMKPKRQRKIKEKLLPTITAQLSDFAKFFAKTYNAAEDEGSVEQPPNDDDDDLGDLPTLEEFEGQMRTSTPKPTSELSQETVIKTEALESNLQSSEMSPIRASPALTKTFAEIMNQDETVRLKEVLEWKKFIKGKIGTQKASDFDVHEEETKIIECIGQIGQSVKYSDMCVGKSAASVARSYSAALYLATTQNIEICNILPGQLSNDTLEVKLLSTDRHHEHLDEYNSHETPQNELQFDSNFTPCGSKRKHLSIAADASPKRATRHY